jgi:hypothetical protein
MADGNQLGASYPTADYFYLNVHKQIGDAKGLDAWLGDVEWFWRRHTAPEALTPEAENEHEMGADNQGCKQLQACSTWYASLYMGLAGLDFDHEGVTLTPWGDRKISIRGLTLRGVAIDLSIRGQGNCVGSLTLNGKPLAAGSHKIAWSTLKWKAAKIALTRTETAPPHPVIVRADGLRVTPCIAGLGQLTATVTGDMSGEVAVRTAAKPRVTVAGKTLKCVWNPGTKTVVIPYAGKREMELMVTA